MKSMMEPQQARVNQVELSLTDAVSQSMEEARMVIPGTQALLGFQFMAIFNQPFESLSPEIKTLHYVAICFTCLSMTLLLSPRPSIAL